MKDEIASYLIDINIIANKDEALPTLDEIKLECLEYLIESDVQNMLQPAGIQDISWSALSHRLDLFNKGGPPPPIILSAKTRICH